MAQTEKPLDSGRPVTRKKFIQDCSMSAIAVAAASSLVSCIVPRKDAYGPKINGKVLHLDENWLFGGKFEKSMLAPDITTKTSNTLIYRIT